MVRPFKGELKLFSFTNALIILNFALPKISRPFIELDGAIKVESKNLNIIIIQVINNIKFIILFLLIPDNQYIFSSLLFSILFNKNKIDTQKLRSKMLSNVFG